MSARIAGNITTTGVANGITLPVGKKGRDRQFALGISGDYTGLTLVALGYLANGTVGYPLPLVRATDGTRSTGSVSPTNAETALFFGDSIGYDQVVIYASAISANTCIAEAVAGDFIEGSVAARPTETQTLSTFPGGITLTGGNGVNLVSIPDNLANALSVVQGANAYMTFITTDAGGLERVALGKPLSFYSAGIIMDVNGNELLKFPATVASAVNEFTLTNAAAGAAPSLAATGGDTNISFTLAAKGTGVIQHTSPIADKNTQTAVTDTATLTIAQLLTKVIDGTPTAGATYTLPTAANLVAGIANCKVGDSFDFVINNKSGGANTITVAAGSGGTADGTLTVAQHVIRPFRIIVTNVTGSSEAYFVYGLGA